MYSKKNEKGYTLVGVVLVVVLLSVLGMSMMTLMLNSVETSTRESTDQSVFYIAESGLTLRMAELENKVDELFESAANEAQFYNSFTEEVENTVVYNNFETNSGEPEAEVNGESLGAGKYKLTSEGTIDGQERMVEQEFSVGLEPGDTGEGGGTGLVPGVALYISDKLVMSGSGTIDGDVLTQSTAVPSIEAEGSASVSGTVFIPEGQNANSSVKLSGSASVKAKEEKIGAFPELPPFPAIPNYPVPADREVVASNGNKTKVIRDGDLLINNYITNNYTLNLNEDLQFRDMKFASNYTLYINLGNVERKIVVRNLDMTNGHIKILGQGNLTIYVTNEITFGSGSTINDQGDISQLNIFLKGSHNANNPKKVRLAGSQTVYGSLYAEDADIEVTGGARIHGNIFTGGSNFEVSGGTSTNAPLILAPNAKFRQIEGGNINGVVVAHSYEISGGTTLNYRDADVKEGPISEEQLGNVEITVKPILEKESVQEK